MQASSTPTLHAISTRRRVRPRKLCGPRSTPSNAGKVRSWPMRSHARSIAVFLRIPRPISRAPLRFGRARACRLTELNRDGRFRSPHLFCRGAVSGTCSACATRSAPIAKIASLVTPPTNTSRLDLPLMVCSFSQFGMTGLDLLAVVSHASCTSISFARRACCLGALMQIARCGRIPWARERRCGSHRLFFAAARESLNSAASVITRPRPTPWVVPVRHSGVAGS